MRKILKKGKIVLISLAISIIALSLNMTAFAMQPNDNVITDLYNYKIISDVSDIRADDNVTRAEVIKMLCIAEGNDLWDNTVMDNQVFDDVPVDYWAAKYIQIGVWDGIINGYEDNTFKPENNVTNQELQKMIVCTLGYDIWCKNYGTYPQAYLYYSKILGITKDLNLVNEDYAKRGDTMQMIYNALDAPILDVSVYLYDEQGNKIPQVRLYDGGNYPFVSYRMVLDGTVEW